MTDGTPGRAGLATLTAPHTAHLSADSLAQQQQQQQQQPRQRLFRQQLMLVQLINYKRQLARRPTGCCRCVLEPVGGGVTGTGTDPAYSPSHLSTSSGHGRSTIWQWRAPAGSILCTHDSADSQT